MNVLLRCALAILLHLVAGLAQADTYGTAGTFTWTAPTGVTSVTVQVWGGGGGGDGGNSHGSGGGGGGAYANQTFAVVPGTVYNLTVGVGGNGGLFGTNAAGGGLSSFGGPLLTTLTANGGSRGATQAGGAGGTSTIPIWRGCAGGGSANPNDPGGGGGGSALSCGLGGDATSSTAGSGGAGSGQGGAGGASGVNGNVGSAPGGGGGGAGAGRYTGGAGGAGRVIITYSPPNHTVTFNSNGGSGTMTAQVANVATNLTSNTFTRSGYTFANWNTAAGGSGTTYPDGASYAFTADVTLYAQWTINTYTVTFDSNGGSGSMSSQSSNYNVAVALTSNSFTRTGYTFAGWNTVAGGGGTSYANGALYPFTSSTTLYAQWTRDLATSFNAVDGSISSYLAGALNQHIYTKLAGTAFTLNLAALNGAGGLMSPAYLSNTNTVTVDLVDDRDGACDPSSCSGTTCQNKLAIATQITSFVSADNSYKQGLSFTVGNAYPILRARITDRTSTTVYACSTDNFSVRPAAFVVTQNTPTPLNAGSTFTLQARAMLSDLSTATTYLGTPILNIGQITGTPGFTSAALLPQAPPALPAATLGVSFWDKFTYDDVGSFTLPATGPGTYGISDSTFTSVDGSSDCVVGSASNTPVASGTDKGKIGCLIGQSAALTVGPFIPDHFEITPSFAAGCGGGGFTYMDQPFTLGYTVTAKSMSRGSPNPPGNTALKLYSGGKLNLAALNGSTDWVARLSPAVTYPLTPTWTNGSYTPASTSYTFIRPTTTSADATWGAFDTLNIGVAIDDADGVGYATSPTMPTLPPTFTGATPTPCTKSGATACRTYASLTGGALAKMRYGRARILNAYGSELLDLPMTLRAQYWNGTGWAQNTNDNCTGDAAPPAANAVSVALKVPATAVDSTLTCVWDTGNPGRSGRGCTAAGPTTPIDKQFREGAAMVIGPAPLQKSDFNLWLQKPTGPGNVTVTVDVPTWLEFNWTGTVGDPSARATFGIYKSPLIYRRENY